MKKIFLFLIISTSIIFNNIHVIADQQDTPITVGLLPDEKTETLLERFEPVRKRLEGVLKRPVKVVVPSPEIDYTYDDLVDKFVKGEVQIAYFGGLTFLRALNRTPAIPLAMRKKDTKFRSYFIARSDMNLNSLDDLRGVKFSFGSVSSTSGHLMPRYFLGKEAGINPEEDFDGQPKFSGTHDKTLEWLVSGRVDAGVVNSTVFDRLLREGKIDPEEVDVIWITPGYYAHIWAAREDVPEDIRNKISNFFLDLTPGIEADDIVLNARMSDYYVVPDVGAYDKLEQVAEKFKLIPKSD